jgi:hypothetical protein
MSSETNTQLKLPERIIGSVDLSRSIRELKAIDDWLNQAAIRGSGQAISMPKTSKSLEEIAALNGVSLLDKNHRTQLIAVLDAFSIHAPRIHMSFAVEPSGQFTQKMVIWMRQNINPVILLEIGLQPTLAAGCTVRTTNKLFDLSLRHRFTEKRLELVKSIAAATVEQKPKQVTTTAQPVTHPAAAAQPVAPAPAQPPDAAPSKPEVKSE